MIRANNKETIKALHYRPFCKGDANFTEYNFSEDHNNHRFCLVMIGNVPEFSRFSSENVFVMVANKCTCKKLVTSSNNYGPAPRGNLYHKGKIPSFCSITGRLRVKLRSHDYRPLWYSIPSLYDNHSPHQENYDMINLSTLQRHLLLKGIR